jgi:hypothetical protein
MRPNLYVLCAEVDGRMVYLNHDGRSFRSELWTDPSLARFYKGTGAARRSRGYKGYSACLDKDRRFPPVTVTENMIQVRPVDIVVRLGDPVR